MHMNRIAIAFFISLAGGCAAIDGNFMGGSTPAATASKEGATAIAYEPMSSEPPAALKEDAPALEAGQVWVPGYYQPVAGSWLWHQGQVQQKKDGYRLVPASYREENGKVYFTPPRWSRTTLVASK
jgi:hypothetical protein